ncbi:MAG: aminotransferase class V-fold PLP-dependent enzyme [Robiginitomaculum sp.]|nr:aminotransferase class V-fold PLP-dependent enzyme [Robiginitomaculum sp.]
MFGFKTRKNKTKPAGGFSAVRGNIIGNDAVINGPFGPRRLMYADYVASGRSYGPIEDTIRDHVLPLYANTHTESSTTGRQSTAYREQARHIIADALNVGEDDAIVFCGAGCTGAIDKLIGILRLKLPHGMSRYGIKTDIAAKNRPVVFIGPYEHHSNDVQWRETIADVVTIEETDDGLLDLDDLEKQLKKYKNRPLKIGSFSAASNVTGIITDVQPVAKILHAHGAMACFDFAASAPYEPIDMNPNTSSGDGTPLDAIFISVHKFIGGPGTPGLLVVKKKWVQNKTPVIPGGGTVSYVSPCAQAYLVDIEHREEGGTPDIVGAIRAGLVFDLREKVGAQKISDHEHKFAKTALARWGKHKNIQILGSNTAKRLPIFSFLIRSGEDKYLHFNFVVALLNDLFGIQSRGGCSCAGPYGHRLLDIDLKTSEEYEAVIATGVEILKPGWVRVGFNYFYSDDDAEMLLSAVEWIADNGKKMLPYYGFDSTTGVWSHWESGAISLSNLTSPDQAISGKSVPDSLEKLIQLADQYASVKPEKCIQPGCCILDTTPEHLRWFSLPD